MLIKYKRYLIELNKIYNTKLLLGVLIVGVIIVVGSFNVYAQNIPILMGLFSPRQIIVTPTPVITATPIPTPVWTVSQKITEAKELLRNTTLTVGNKPIAYTETRYTSVKGKLALTVKSFKEPEKEIALAILNISSGEIKIVTIIKRGAELIAPSGFNINILRRPNGIIWNGWNTAYKVNIPTDSVVIANVYPNETDTTVAKKVKGRTVYSTQRTIKYQLYSPYSPDLHSSDLVKSGIDYTNTVISKAFDDLRVANVKSRAISGTLVIDVFKSRSDFFSRIPLLEQTDLTEFQIDPQNTIERAQVIIGANQDQAFNATCNSSSACGWLQFTPRTYANIVKSYPSAKLIKDFKTGAADHLNSMKAAILLYDENLRGLMLAHGKEIVNDPKLEEYLASSYNGAPRWVYKTLTASILGGIQDWVNALTSKTGGLKDETKGYLVKLRWLQEHQSSSLATLSQ
ncbi:MAG: hypothetical protein A2735_01835 [Candidatus Yanofskybacteria bacterium RIFCSPHIGHO2_01_FULL_41_21]|uniref:Transglycosylase SLT domain-containing protein n=1 Tax=Candidatus Yanofskybacteria bacterium RIFCSPHIGHO2_01_FULL_41_21 TaxID=1802660 RepID=A0A1F8E9I6_9BACT|nr:MAG: hypothetical protein A2735_01835 [Candidatus Yanofskybacteria bacterium RIFCSPHIGHO2_01_FULL_41_21]